MNFCYIMVRVKLTNRTPLPSGLTADLADSFYSTHTTMLSHFKQRTFSYRKRLCQGDEYNQ